MNIRVTGDAAASHDAFIRHRTGSQGLLCLQIVRVQEIRVALLAEERNRRDQQRALIRAVGCVAVEAVLTHRRMFEQEWSAFFRMALIARLVDRIGLEQRAGQGAVRIVAVIAAHLPFRQRHVRAAIELQANILVTLRTGIVDRGLGHQPLHGEFRHGVVAVAARQVVALVY